MLSTDAGTPAAGNGSPPVAPKERRGLRDHPLGKLLLFGLVLLAALIVARTCGSNNQEVSQDEAIEIAKENASFEPCPELQCVQIRYVPRGIPVRGFWGVVLSDRLDSDGEPNRIESFLIDVQTGEAERP
jgi:hypothetical protein